MVTNQHTVDIATFDSIYHQYHHAIFKNICKLVNNQDAAEDILQEVFLAFWNNRHQLDLKQGAGGWLFVVSYNKSIQYLKKMAREKAWLATHPDISPATDDYTDEMGELRLHLINDAIEQLSPRKKQVFHLCRIEGKTLNEAATILGISYHTAKEYLQSSSESIRAYIMSNQATVPVLGVLFLSSYLQC